MCILHMFVVYKFPSYNSHEHTRASNCMTQIWTLTSLIIMLCFFNTMLHPCSCSCLAVCEWCHQATSLILAPGELTVQEFLTGEYKWRLMTNASMPPICCDKHCDIRVVQSLGVNHRTRQGLTREAIFQYLSETFNLWQVASNVNVLLS